MATSLEILSNRQADVCIGLELDGVEYSDSSKYSSTAIPKLKTSFVRTRNIGQAFERQDDDGFSSVRILNNASSPLTDEFNRSIKGAPYTATVFGKINCNAHNEDITYYENRSEFISGTVDATSYDSGDFLVVLGSGNRSLDYDLLEDTRVNAVVSQDSDFNFTSLSSSSAQSVGDISVLSTPVGVGLSNNISFSPSVGRVELTVGAPEGDSDVRTGHNFVQISPTLLRSSESLDIDVEIANISDSTINVVIRLGESVNDYKWLVRQIYGDIINYSHTPVSIDREGDPQSNTIAGAFPNSIAGTPANNSVITWENLGGVSEISFSITNTLVGGSLVPDSAGNIYTENLKMWLISATVGSAVPSNISFFPLADSFPAGGVGTYIWNNLGGQDLRLSASYVGGLAVEPDGNTVTYGATGSTPLTVTFEYAEAQGVDAAALVNRPLALGAPSNVSPVHLGGTEYDIGDDVENVRELRNNGVNVPRVGAISTFDINQSNGTLSYYYEPSQSPLLLVSGDVGAVTCDIVSYIRTFSDSVARLIQGSNLTVSANDIDPIYRSQQVSIYISDQQTAAAVLSDILASIDAVKIIEGGELKIVERKNFATSNFDHVIDEDVDIVGAVSVSAELDKYHLFRAIYDLNHTVQQAVIPYRSEGTIVDNSDDSLIQFGSLSRVISMPFISSSLANRVASKRERESLRRHTVEFTVKDRPFSILPNDRVNLITNLLPSGMFLPEEVIDETGSKNTIIRGTYYVAP